VRPLQPHRQGSERYWFVSAERFMAGVTALKDLFAALDPRPDCVVGIKRSGLFPAVYLSHVFELPMFTDGEAKVFPGDKFSRPVVVDTTVWSGVSVRRTYNRLMRAGVPAESIAALAIWVRDDPRPDVDRLHYLELTDRIMHFWYDEEELP